MPRHPPIALTSRLRIHTTIDRPACMTASIYRRFGLNSDRYKTPGRARDPAGLGALWISQLDNHCCNCRSTCVDRQPRHRFLEPIHNVKDETRKASTAANRGSGFLHSWKLFAATPPASRRGGGASRDRTDDLKLAKLALSQLSYGPVTTCECSRMFALTSRSDAVVGREGVEPSTSRLSGVRSNHLSYRPPCHPPAKRPRAA